jgi:pimeloyl-ACP methyl ester carboxylesterase
MSRIEANGVVLNVTELPQRIGPGQRKALTGKNVAGKSPHAGPTVPIVMIHGLAASQAFWYAAGAQFLTLLGPCLMYDLRGHGKSGTPETGYGVGNMADDLGALLADRGMTRVHLIAHSFGGMIAIAHALRNPESVSSLTLVDVRIRPIQKKITIPIRQIPPAVEHQLAEMGLDLSSIPSHDDGVGYLRTVARIEVEAGDMAADLLSQIYRHPRLFRSRKNAERWIDLTERVSLIADLDREETFTATDLRRLAMPMLILVGGLSSTLPSAREMARICPHALLREVPDVGHFFPMSQPRLFLRPTLRFLRAVEMGRLRSGPGGD